MTKNKTILWVVKGIAAIFNFPATAYVFFELLSDTNRPSWLVYFNTIFAVLLIDALFIWVLGVLEDSTIAPVQRIPVVFSSIALSIAVFAIGVIDEGILAFAPRIGIFLLVFNDLVLWVIDCFIAWGNYFTRDRIEQRIRDREVIARRKAKEQAIRTAYKRLKPEMADYHTNLLREGLELNSEHSEKPVNTSKIFNKEDLDQYVKQNGKGFYWIRPGTGEKFYETATGKHYTERGAKLALIRDCKETGYAVQ